MSLSARDRVAAALRDEFSAWIAGHPNAGVFDWSVAAENVLRAANPPGAVSALELIAGAEPETTQYGRAGQFAGAQGIARDALAKLKRGQ